MTTYLETYCTISDIQLVAPFVFDYDRKRTISNWVSHSGSSSSEIWKAGSVGKLSMLYENDIEQTSLALKYFGYGIPAFAVLKIFANFFFARDDTKTPFYLSVISVILNIVISVSFFGQIGFIIIPIATSISSWVNVFMHFYFIKKRNLHIFDSEFIYKFPRMILSVVVMGLILYLLLGFFSDKFDYNESWKFIYLFIIVIISLISYF